MSDVLSSDPDNETSEAEEIIVPSKKAKKALDVKQHKTTYRQKYRAEWELKPEFANWLAGDKTDSSQAYCKLCRCHIQARLATLHIHAKSSKHVSMSASVAGTSKLSKFFKQNTLSDETKIAELKFCAFVAEHNLSFRVMDHLSTLISGTFHDSAIAKAFSCKRTKTANMTYNVLAQEFKTELRKNIQGTSKAGEQRVSILDESTDKGTVKCMAIVIKFFCEKLMKVNTRLLNLVPVHSETAAELFDTLKCDLAKRDLEMKNVIGFAADTTNVIFGEHNSVASRIVAANPDCLTIKCACHSCALAVSHACAVLPRNIEQVVKECHNYFSLSSKRCHEFQEFQEFTESKQYRMLRFYSIRWLSLGSCVERILSQWNALQMFFSSQYLVDRLQASAFLYEQFSDLITKFYFAFLSYIIPLVNKLNVIFQCQSPAIHKFHSTCQLAYKSILSCFVKPVLLKGDVAKVDPANTSNHLPLTQMYLGVEAAKLVASPSFKTVDKVKINECFKRCQQFLIELCRQLKMRLPLDNPIIRDLKFLDPQVAMSGTIGSIANVAARFPNVLPAEKIQQLDQEWRDLILDDEISNLADTCASSPAEEFWAKVVVNEKYRNLGTFVKAMLCLPVSNADCERVFSQVNLIKTKHRNRFSTEGVASVIFVKDGIKSNAGSCDEFEPTRSMLDRCNKTMYTNVRAIYGDEVTEDNAVSAVDDSYESTS